MTLADSCAPETLSGARGLVYKYCGFWGWAPTNPTHQLSAQQPTQPPSRKLNDEPSHHCPLYSSRPRQDLQGQQPYFHDEIRIRWFILAEGPTEVPSPKVRSVLFDNFDNFNNFNDFKNLNNTPRNVERIEVGQAGRRHKLSPSPAPERTD